MLTLIAVTTVVVILAANSLSDRVLRWTVRTNSNNLQVATGRPALEIMLFSKLAASPQQHIHDQEWKEPWRWLEPLSHNNRYQSTLQYIQTHPSQLCSIPPTCCLNVLSRLGVVQCRRTNLWWTDNKAAICIIRVSPPDGKHEGKNMVDGCGISYTYGNFLAIHVTRSRAPDVTYCMLVVTTVVHHEARQQLSPNHAPIQCPQWTPSLDFALQHWHWNTTHLHTWEVILITLVVLQ